LNEVLFFKLSCEDLFNSKTSLLFITPILEAHALLIIGVSSLQSSTNFFLSFSFCYPALE